MVLELSGSLLMLMIYSAGAELPENQRTLFSRASMEPMLAYVVPDGSAGEGCDEECLKALAVRLRSGCPGVRRAVVDGSELVLEVQAGEFKSDLVQKRLQGLRVEMRAPYRGIELHFAGQAPFPPATHIEEKTLIVELGEDLKKAIEDKLDFRFSARMRCVGRLDGSDNHDAILTRYEVEKRPPFAQVPFMVEADLDGDHRADLFLRLEGLPEIVVFNKPHGLEVVPVTRVPEIFEEIPHCDQTPSRYARAVHKAKMRCADATPGHLGDAVERVSSSARSDLLFWTPAGKFATCDPFVEGSKPPPLKRPREVKPKDSARPEKDLPL